MQLYPDWYQHNSRWKGKPWHSRWGQTKDQARFEADEQKRFSLWDQWGAAKLSSELDLSWERRKIQALNSGIGSINSWSYLGKRSAQTCP